MAEPALIPQPVVDTPYFEQPLNERMRTFLRLDFLYNQAVNHNDMPSAWGSRAAVASLIDMLAILTRVDVRGEVLKELERQMGQLALLESRAGIDTGRLRALTANLQRLRAELYELGSAWLQPLRDSEFLSAIKHRSAIPGGTCEFDLPDYFFWLNRSPDERIDAFAQWLTLLRPLCDAISELLWLTRQNGRMRRENAVGGIFNVTFDRDSPFQLLRISLAPGSNLFPEISGSHYRCSIRFLEWHSITTRPTQTGEDVPFSLICCA